MTTLIDTNTSDLRSIIDFDLADTLIADTAEPASPQFTHTVVAGDFPPNSNSYGDNFQAVISFGGKNTDAATHTLYVQATLNGVNVGGVVSASIGTAKPYWAVPVKLATNALNAGDVVGIKVWASAANMLDYRYATLYIIAREFAIPGAGQIMRFGQRPGALISGAVAGVDYTVAKSTHTMLALDGGDTTVVGGGEVVLDGCSVNIGILDSFGPIATHTAPILHSLLGASRKLRLMDV